MKLLNKDKVNIIIENKNKLIVEKAVHWNQSLIGLLVNTILTPFTWLKNLTAPTVGQIEVLSMQWGAEYVSAITQVIEEEQGKETSETSDENEDIDDKSLIYDDEIYTTNNKYLEKLNTLKNNLQEIFNDQTKEDIYKTYEKVNNLHLINTINSNEFKNFIEFVYTDNNVYFEDIIKEYPYDEKIKPILENISKIEKNIITKATEPAYKDKKFINDINIKITELSNIYKDLNEKIKTKSEEILKQQDDENQTSEKLINNFLNNNNNLKLITEINAKDSVKSGINKAKDTIKAVTSTKKPELPSDVKGLMSQELLDVAKLIKDIKNKTSKKINYASLNTLRYEANYLMNKSEDNKDKLQHAFESNLLNVNNYFQDVIDTKNVMSKATGTVDANTEKEIGTLQESFDEISGLKIKGIKEGSKFVLGEVYAFQSIITSAAKKNTQCVLFLTPLFSSVGPYNAKGVFRFKFLGAYKYDKKTTKISKINPFINSVVSSKLSGLIKNGLINVDTLIFSGLRPGSSVYSILCVNDKKNKQSNSFIYGDDVLSIDGILATDISSNKDKTISKSLEKLALKNTTIKIKIQQRYDVSMEEIEKGTYPELDKDKIDLNSKKTSNIVNDVNKLITTLS